VGGKRRTSATPSADYAFASRTVTGWSGMSREYRLAANAPYRKVRKKNLLPIRPGREESARLAQRLRASPKK
jgi:hypothetical protein